MRNFTFLLLLAAFFLASFCGATSPDTTQDSRLFSSANAIERGTKRVLRVASTTTDKTEERGNVFSPFKANTLTAKYLDKQALSAINVMMAALKRFNRESGDDLNTAIAAFATKAKLSVDDVERAYNTFKLAGASTTKKFLKMKMALHVRSTFFETMAVTLFARLNEKPLDELLKTLKASGLDDKLIRRLYGDKALGKDMVKITLMNLNDIEMSGLQKTMKSLKWPVV